MLRDRRARGRGSDRVRRFGGAFGLAALLLVSTTVTAANADDLTAYLQRPGLERLLVVHLEEQLEATRDSNERQALAQRLAALFGTLLERTRDAEEIASIEQRGRILLEFVTGLESDELQLALIGARHRSASRLMEQHRLRSTTDEELTTAAESLRRMRPELERLERDLTAASRSTELRLSRSGGVEATVLADRAERLARLIAQATFLRAWCLYYESLLAPDRRLADEAIPLFARVLDLPERTISASEVSRSLMERESYARALLGMTLAQALRRRSSFAESWIELLFLDETHPAVSAEAPAWRLAILLDAEPPDFERAIARLTEIEEHSESVPSAWFRLAAARGIEASSESEPAQRLASRAVSALIARNELAHVLDLARRFGGTALRGDGFVVHYVRGVERFENARAVHQGDEPTEDPATRRLYDEAAEALSAAITAADADADREGLAACRHLLAWCHYYRGQLAAAADAFAEAARGQRLAEAAESRWMAIVSLDRLVGASPRDPVLRRTLEESIDEFLEEHPGSPRAGRLRLRRAIVIEPSREAIEELEQIPQGSDAHHGAQRQAVHVLYRLIREATDREERAELSREFMVRVLPILDEDDRRIADGDETVYDGRNVRLRQAIEVALTPEIDRPSLARDLLQRLSADADATETHGPEIALRRVQIAVAEDDLATAERWAAALRDHAAEAPNDESAADWFMSAARMIFRLALVQWRRDGGDDRPGNLEAVDRWGSEIIAESLAIEDDAVRLERLADPRQLPFLSGTAEAVVRRWLNSRDPDLAARSETLLRLVLEIRENDQQAIRWLSIILEETDRFEAALALVRRLVAGTRSGSEEWFEARFRQINLLRRVDVERARAVMEQHKTLHPDFGPEPWGSRLRQLDEQLRRSDSDPDDQLPSRGIRT